MARNHGCLKSKLIFVSVIFSWVIFRSVSARTITALRMDDLRSGRHKRHDFGECKCEKVPEVLTSILTPFGQKLFELNIDGHHQDTVILRKCRNAGARCGDTTAEREGRPRICRQRYFKHTDELLTLGITDNKYRDHLQLDLLPNGCECVDPQDSWTH